MKAMAQTFGDKTLKVFGLNTARIVGVVATVLPVVEAKEKRTDFVFSLEDGTLLHLEFQTTTKQEDLKRFLICDARLVNRDDRKIQTAVIYSGHIEHAPDMLDSGSITYRVTNVYMKGFDGDEEYARLKKKIENSEPLKEEDLLKLIFLPLMKSKSSEAKMTIQAAELAKTIPGEMGTFALGVLVALGDRFLSDEEMKKLMEVLSMTRIGQWFREEREIEIARTALAKGYSVDSKSILPGCPGKPS